MKKDVPDHIKAKAREMAEQELARKLEELNMSMGEAKEYNALLGEVQSHVAQLHDLLESACRLPSMWIISANVAGDTITSRRYRPVCTRGRARVAQTSD